MRPASAIEGFIGDNDPAVLTRIAHDSAAALLSRVRNDPDPELVTRLSQLADEYGLDTIAELWSHSAARSLPGALWRVYLVRAVIVNDSESTSLAYQRGAVLVEGIDPIVAGAATPTGPEEIKALADAILHGVFAGDFGAALERAAAFSRVVARGYVDLAHDVDAAHPDRATTLTTRASRLASMGEELSSCARLWRSGSLD